MRFLNFKLAISALLFNLVLACLVVYQATITRLMNIVENWQKDQKCKSLENLVGAYSF